jgi:NADPH:quinone reductase-like Zn-dependent oxidoreductase
MRAIFYEEYGDIDVMTLGDAESPVIADDEVLIRVRAASLNPVDWKLRNGMLREFFDPEFPIIPGRDGCGEIVTPGESAGDSGLTEGQLVSFISSSMRQGSMAELAAVTAQDNVVPAAKFLSLQESAALPLVGLSAWNALVETAEIKTGMRVLIHGGSGGVGTVAIQIARHFGAEVFATCSARNVERVASLGAQPIAYDRTDFTTVVQDCDIVLDTVGGQVHEDSYRVLKKGGRLVWLLARPFNDLSNSFDVAVLQANVFGNTANLRKVIELADDGIIKPVIGHSLELTEFKQAFQFSESGNAGGKIVLKI